MTCFKGLRLLAVLIVVDIDDRFKRMTCFKGLRHAEETTFQEGVVAYLLDVMTCFKGLRLTTVDHSQLLLLVNWM